MFRIKECARGMANDVAEFQAPRWNTAQDGKRVIVFEIQDVPHGADSGLPVAQICVAADYAGDLIQRLNMPVRLN